MDPTPNESEWERGNMLNSKCSKACMGSLSSTKCSNLWLAENTCWLAIKIKFGDPLSSFPAHNFQKLHLKKQ